jgi:thioredoxin reductase
VNTHSRVHDVIIVGAGPAGLSAALILGRCRRSVLVFDNGKPRNAASRALNGFLTRDGVPPEEFRQAGRRELAKYSTVELRDGDVVHAECRAGREVTAAADDVEDGRRFAVELGTGERFFSRTLLLATGVVDRLPDIVGFAELYGTSVFHCPYCDGWEVRDQPLAVYGKESRGFGLALELTAWSRDLVLCTDGPSELDDRDRSRLEQNGIQLREDPVASLGVHDGRLSHIVFRNGDTLPRRALFFNTGQYQRSDLLSRLGCEFNDKGTVRTGKYETTHLRGLFVCGDASRAVQWVVVAAAEGAEAAFAINTELIKEGLK